MNNRTLVYITLLCLTTVVFVRPDEARTNEMLQCSQLPHEQQLLLTEAELTQCLMPFGVLVAADHRFPESFLIQTARIIAQYLDPDHDGQVDRMAVHEQWISHGDWIPMPWDPEHWYQIEESLNDEIGYGMIAPRWWMDGWIRKQGPNPVQQATLFEEVTHLYTDRGLAYVYPDLFSVERYTCCLLYTSPSPRDS